MITSEVLAAKKAREALLAGDETERREFKSSAFYSYTDPNIPQKAIFEASVLKPVAGLLNARGGFLFIGVDDNATPLGIQPDLDMKRWNTEQYVRHLTGRIGEEFGSSAATCTHISIETVRGLEICVVEVDPSPDPVWLLKAEQSGKRKVFYVRTNNSTRELDGRSLSATSGNDGISRATCSPCSHVGCSPVSSGIRAVAGPGTVCAVTAVEPGAGFIPMPRSSIPSKRFSIRLGFYVTARRRSVWEYDSRRAGGSPPARMTDRHEVPARANAKTESGQDHSGPNRTAALVEKGAFPCGS